MLKRLFELHPVFEAPNDHGGDPGVLDPAAGDLTDDLDLENLDLENLPSDKTVPLSAVLKMRKDLQGKLSAKDEELNYSKDLLTILKAQQGQGTPQNANANAAPERPKTGTFLDDIEDPDEPLTAGQAIRLLAESNKRAPVIAALQKAQADPDFQVLRDKHLINVLKADPSLQAEILSIADPLQREIYCYRLAKSDPDYHKSKLKAKITEEPPNKDAEKILKNLEKPGSPSGVGSRGGSIASTEADKLKTMDRKDFLKVVEEKRRAGRQKG